MHLNPHQQESYQAPLRSFIVATYMNVGYKVQLVVEFYFYYPLYLDNSQIIKKKSLSRHTWRRPVRSSLRRCRPSAFPASLEASKLQTLLLCPFLKSILHEGYSSSLLTPKVEWNGIGPLLSGPHHFTLVLSHLEWQLSRWLTKSLGIKWAFQYLSYSSASLV